MTRNRRDQKGHPRKRGSNLNTLCSGNIKYKIRIFTSNVPKNTFKDTLVYTSMEPVDLVYVQTLMTSAVGWNIATCVVLSCQCVGVESVHSHQRRRPNLSEYVISCSSTSVSWIFMIFLIRRLSSQLAAAKSYLLVTHCVCVCVCV